MKWASLHTQLAVLLETVRVNRYDQGAHSGETGAQRRRRHQRSFREPREEAASESTRLWALLAGCRGHACNHTFIILFCSGHNGDQNSLCPPSGNPQQTGGHRPTKYTQWEQNCGERLPDSLLHLQTQVRARDAKEGKGHPAEAEHPERLIQTFLCDHTLEEGNSFLPPPLSLTRLLRRKAGVGGAQGSSMPEQ